MRKLLSAIFFQPPEYKDQHRRYLRAGWKILIGLTIVTLIGGSLVGANVAYESHKCEVLGDKLNKEGEWTFWGDCRVNVDGQMVPADSYRVVETDD